MKQILCLWLPNWPIQRVMAAEPVLVGRSVVLETRDARRGLLIAAANLAARRSGARAGMRLSELEAMKPVDDQTLWEIRPYAPQADLEALCDLAEQAQQFSPLVGLEQLDDQPWHGRNQLQPQTLLLDASGIPDLFGGEQDYLTAIARWLKERRYFAYMALASTIGAAWALANYDIARRQRSSATADEAGKKTAEPIHDPLTYVPDSRTLISEQWEEAELLSALPIAALRIDSETIDKLRRLGVGCLNQLWQLPRDGLASRLGSRLMQRSDQALGLANETIIALHGSPDWTCEWKFDYPTLKLDVLQAALSELCVEMGQRLKQAGQGALRCLCRLDLVRSPPMLMQLGLFRPSDEADHLHMLLCGQLEQLLRDALEQSNTAPVYTSRMRQRSQSLPSQPAADEQGSVSRMTLEATLIGPMIWQQTQLFEQEEVRHKQHLARLIDTLSGRLGRERVLEAREQRDSQPDQAVSYQPLTGRRQDGVPQHTIRKLQSRLASRGAEPHTSDPLRRPTNLFTPPELLLGVTLRDGLIHEFVHEGRRIFVLRHWGPERLESGWWRGPSMRRDYYRIEARDGSWWWVYCDLATTNWYVHGLFA